MNEQTNPEITVRSRLFYTASLVVSLVGILAIALTVESSIFLAAAASTAVAGHYVSSRLRFRRKNLRIVETVVIAICLATYARLFATGDTSPIFSPGTAMFQKELSLAVMLVWAEVVRSFSLITDEAVLFTTVPSLALIGVVATTAPGPDTVLYFSVWLVATLVMFLESSRTHEKALQGSERFRTVAFGAVVGIGCVLTGYFVSPLLQTGSQSVFAHFAPTLTSPRKGSEISVRDFDRNVLEISEGPVRLSNREEMRVKSTTESYWRSKVWDVYSGRDWKSTGRMDRRQYMDRTMDGLVFSSSYYPQDHPGQEVVQTFYSNKGFQGHLYAAPEPVLISITSRELMVDQFNSWRLPKSLRSPIMRYQVLSYIPDARPDQLRAASEEYPEWLEHFRNRYDAPVEVRRKAQEITRGIDNAYDKVIALKAYLASHCTYDLETPPLPREESDAVRHFLFESRRGYCDVFASALAVMARSLGIPSRIATGYMPGEYDPESQEWIVRERDAHSWPEIYFPGHGWVPIEATPSGDSYSPGFWAALWTELRYLWMRGSARIGLLVAAFGLSLMALRVFYPADFDVFRRRRRRHVRHNVRRAQKSWRSFARALSRIGVKAVPSTTPLELAGQALDRLPPDAQQAREAVAESARLLTEVLYGHPADESSVLDDLELAIRWTKRELAGLRGTLNMRVASGDAPAVESAK